MGETLQPFGVIHVILMRERPISIPLHSTLRRPLRRGQSKTVGIFVPNSRLADRMCRTICGDENRAQDGHHEGQTGGIVGCEKKMS
jgi:hypothetical protein